MDKGITIEDAKVALDDMDDYAKMACGIDPISARETLAKFITQYEQLAAELEALKAVEPVAYLKTWELPRGMSDRTIKTVHLYPGTEEFFGVENLQVFPLYTGPQLSQIPEGWKLTPIEPTEEMFAACKRATWIGSAYAELAYKAMLEAAPQPETKK